MKGFVALIVAGVLISAAPAFAQDTAVAPGYVAPGYVGPGYVAPGYVTSTLGYATTNSGYVASPGFVSGPFGLLALPFQIAALPFQMLVPANGAVVATTGTALVPANPDCGVWHDWNGRYTSMCGL
jgi:hypothetical protein